MSFTEVLSQISTLFKEKHTKEPVWGQYLDSRPSEKALGLIPDFLAIQQHLRDNKINKPFMYRCESVIIHNKDEIRRLMSVKGDKAVPDQVTAVWNLLWRIPQNVDWRKTAKLCIVLHVLENGMNIYEREYAIPTTHPHTKTPRIKYYTFLDEAVFFRMHTHLGSFLKAFKEYLAS